MQKKFGPPALTKAGAIAFYETLDPWTVDEVIDKQWLRECLVPHPKARQLVCCACVVLARALCTDTFLLFTARQLDALAQ